MLREIVFNDFYFFSELKDEYLVQIKVEEDQDQKREEGIFCSMRI